MAVLVCIPTSSQFHFINKEAGQASANPLQGHEQGEPSTPKNALVAPQGPGSPQGASRLLATWALGVTEGLRQVWGCKGPSQTQWGGGLSESASKEGGPHHAAIHLQGPPFSGPRKHLEWVLEWVKLHHKATQGFILQPRTFCTGELAVCRAPLRGAPCCAHAHTGLKTSPEVRAGGRE